MLTETFDALFLPIHVHRQHIVDLGLEDPAVKNEALGFIRIFLKVTPVTEVEFATSQELDKKQKSASSKVWKSVLSVTLLEGKNLPAMDHNGTVSLVIIMVKMFGLLILQLVNKSRGNPF